MGSALFTLPNFTTPVMSAHSTIELLNEPFGEPAYWDRDILSDACKSIPTKPLELTIVMLECGGAPIGSVTNLHRQLPHLS